MGSQGYLTSQQVAERLGVKVETVYAYVSRGMLGSVRRPGRRESLFSATEVDRLVNQGVVGRVQRRRIGDQIRSALTLIEDDELYYRGYAARELASRYRFEAVTTLLWRDALPSTGEAVFTAPRESAECARAAISTLSSRARLIDQIRVGVAALGAEDPWRFDLSIAAVCRAGASMTHALVEALNPNASPLASVAEALWPVLTERSPEVDVLDRALVLLADHGLTASTLSARIAASARAHTYAVVSAGLGALDGPQHGTMSTAAYRFLRQAESDPVSALAERLHTGEGIPGFGHIVYQTRDPRAEALFGLMAGSPTANLVNELVSHHSHRTGQFPNIDMALAAIMHAYDMRPDAGEAIFALARATGWIAHALEEYAQSAMRFRAVGSYSGPRPRSLPVPMGS